jgi:hypothetical protein
MLIKISIDRNAQLLFKKYSRGIRLVGVLVLCVMSISAVVYSAATIPHVFHPGEKISADEVNENFAALKSRIDELESLIARAEGAPVGAIAPFAGVSDRVPAGWFICDGREVSRFRDGGTEFTDLFTVIGVTWGVGDGSTTYNLPDLRGVFLRGANKAISGAGERSDSYRDEDFPGRIWANEMQRNEDGIGSWQTDEFEIHDHANNKQDKYNKDIGSSGGHFQSLVVDEGSISADISCRYTSLTGGKETRPKNAAVHFIIKQ